MVKYLLVEDERFAYEELKRMMQRLRPSWQLAGWAESVEQAVLLLRQGSLDLMIVDIRLSDGLSFEIFEQCPVDLPVIFTTAYDEYAIKAFKVNSIDYLLKPLEAGALERAFIKFEKIERRVQRLAAETLTRLEASLQRKNYISRLLISINDRFESVDIGTVAFFLSEDKYVYAVCTNGKEHITSFRSLNEIDDQLDPQRF